MLTEWSKATDLSSDTRTSAGDSNPTPDKTFCPPLFDNFLCLPWLNLLKFWRWIDSFLNWVWESLKDCICKSKLKKIIKYAIRDGLCPYSNSTIEVIYRIEIWKNDVICGREDILYQFISPFLIMMKLKRW